MTKIENDVPASASDQTAAGMKGYSLRWSGLDLDILKCTGLEMKVP